MSHKPAVIGPNDHRAAMAMIKSIRLYLLASAMPFRSAAIRLVGRPDAFCCDRFNLCHHCILLLRKLGTKKPSPCQGRGVIVSRYHPDLLTPHSVNLDECCSWSRRDTLHISIDRLTIESSSAIFYFQLFFVCRDNTQAVTKPNGPVYLPTIVGICRDFNLQLQRSFSMLVRR